jgi:hypothetical protein
LEKGSVMGMDPDSVNPWPDTDPDPEFQVMSFFYQTDVQATGEAFSLKKRTSSTSKKEIY